MLKERKMGEGVLAYKREIREEPLDRLRYPYERGIALRVGE